MFLFYLQVETEAGKMTLQIRTIVLEPVVASQLKSITLFWNQVRKNKQLFGIFPPSPQDTTTEMRTLKEKSKAY